jgi:hypothetical protein
VDSELARTARKLVIAAKVVAARRANLFRHGAVLEGLQGAIMNCSAQACMDVCDFACGFDACPGETGTVFDEDATYFAKDKGMNVCRRGPEP